MSLIVGLAIVFAMLFIAKKAASNPLLGDATEQQYFAESQYLLYGITLIDDGYLHYPDWRSSMLREFDDHIDWKLEQYFEVAKGIAKHPRSQWQTHIEHHLEKTLVKQNEP